ncbi:MAG TPA: chaperone modulator CbpM [Burkholderiales bacterium]|nr:chaperone modulator CbpM [Burkholderiales bacterium]
MKIEITEASDVLWLDEHHELSLAEFVEFTGLSIAELQHLIDCDALLPVATAEPAAARDAADTRFSAQYLALARAASRLRNDFDLDTNGLTLTLHLLSRIHELEAELLDLRAQWPRSLR